MSNANDILSDLGDLIDAVEKLLKTETAQQAPVLAVDLGAEDQFIVAIDFLIDKLDWINTNLKDLSEFMNQSEALSGLFELVEPFVTAIAQLTEASGEQLAEMGLGDVVKVTGPVSQAVEFGGNVLASGENFLEQLPSVDISSKLLREIQELSETLGRLKEKTLIAQQEAA